MKKIYDANLVRSQTAETAFNAITIILWYHEWSFVDDFLIKNNVNKNLGSESMDCLVNSQYLASDSSLPLLRCSSLLVPLLRLPLFPFPGPADDRVPPFDDCSIGLCPFDIWPLFAGWPIFNWSLDIPVILRLVEVLGEQGDSSRLVILRIQSSHLYPSNTLVKDSGSLHQSLKSLIYLQFF